MGRRPLGKGGAGVGEREKREAEARQVPEVEEKWVQDLSLGWGLGPE